MGGSRTVQLEEIVVAGLGSKLLGVDDGGVEGRHGGWFACGLEEG